MGYKGESKIHVATLHLHLCLKVFGVTEAKPELFKRYNAIHRRNHYPADSRVCFVHIYMYFWIAIYPIHSSACQQLGPDDLFLYRFLCRFYVAVLTSKCGNNNKVEHRVIA